MLPLILIKVPDGLHACVPMCALVPGGRHLAHMANATQGLKEGIVQRWLAQAAQKFGVRVGDGLMMLEHLLVFHPTEELDLAKLLGLESTRRFELSAESEEVRG